MASSDAADAPSGGARPGLLTFESILKSKVWGGDRLARFGKAVAPGAHVGEAWEIADLDETSAGGGGGGAAMSVIARGPLAGRTLRDALRIWGPLLCRSTGGQAPDAFPLLIKFLDARENLSVQAHPSPTYARAHPGAHLKTESWVVLEAGLGACLYIGLRAGATVADLRRAVESGTVPEVLRTVPAIIGECHHLPSGCVHALGAGVLVAEVQTPSDTTFRVYDWGRTDRELHIDEALASAQVDAAPAPTRWDRPGTGALVQTDAYSLLRINAPAGRTVGFAGANACVVMGIDGGGVLRARFDAEDEEIALAPGVTALVPACARGLEIAGVHSGLSALVAVVGGETG